jgi:hypothetical protein
MTAEICDRPLTEGRMCYIMQNTEQDLFPGSSMAEQPAVNRWVVGSNPTQGAIILGP